MGWSIREDSANRQSSICEHPVNLPIPTNLPMQVLIYLHGNCQHGIRKLCRERPEVARRRSLLHLPARAVLRAVTRTDKPARREPVDGALFVRANGRHGVERVLGDTPDEEFNCSQTSMQNATNSDWLPVQKAVYANGTRNTCGW